jgi:hypothetical protein
MELRWRVGILLAILLLSSCALHIAAKDVLKVALEDAIEAQQVGEEVTEDVKAKIIEVAPEGTLTSGTGDVATTGNLHLNQHHQYGLNRQHRKGSQSSEGGKPASLQQPQGQPVPCAVNGKLPPKDIERLLRILKRTHPPCRGLCWRCGKLLRVCKAWRGEAC